MSFIVFAWLAVFFYGISAIVGKLATKYHIANPWLYNFVWNLFTLLLTVPIALYAGVGLPHRWDALFVLGFFNALVSILYILALYQLDLSVLSPLYILRAPLSALLGIVLFGEILTITQAVLIGIITFAGMFVSIDEGLTLRSFFRKPIALGLSAIVVSAIYGATVKNAMLYNGFWEVTLWSTILTQIILLATVPAFGKEIVKTRLMKYQGIATSAIFSAVGMLAAYKAYAANIGITSAIMALPLSMILAFLFAVFAPKLLEKHTMKVYAIRFAAAAVMFVAALQFSR